MHIRDHSPNKADAVLLLPGTPTPADHLDCLTAALALSHRVLVPDFPGYGRSKALPAPYDWEAVNAQLEAQLLERGIRRCHVVGYSGGAYRAVLIALSGKLEVPRLVTIGGFAVLTPDHAEAMRGFAAALRAGVDVTDAAVATMLAPSTAKERPWLRHRLVALISCVDPNVLADELEGLIRAPDLLPACKTFGGRALVLLGDQDASTPYEKSKALAGALPGAVLKTLSGGHDLTLECPVSLVAEVVAFLAS